MAKRQIYFETPDAKDGNKWFWRECLVLGHGVIRKMHERLWCIEAGGPGEPLDITEMVLGRQSMLLQRRCEWIQRVTWDLIIHGKAKIGETNNEDIMVSCRGEIVK